MNEAIYTKLRLAAKLAIVALCAAITVCSCSSPQNADGKSPIQAETSGENADEPKEISIPDNLPEMDYGGYGFRVYIRDTEGRNADFYAEEENGDLINDAVYKRNKTIEDRFNVAIEPILYSDEWDSSAERAILAGSDSYDIMAMHGVFSFSFAQKSLVLDWLSDMPYVNFDMPWWNDDVTKGFAAFGSLYGVTGDMSHLSLASVMGLLFNKNLFKDMNIDYPYAEVIAGSWTLDKFYSIVKSGGADLNGDGAMTADADRYGLHMPNEWGYPIAVLYHGGDRVISLDDENVPVLSLYNPRTIDIFERFFDMLNTPGAGCIGNVPNWGNPESIDVFKDGRALFVAAGMGSIIGYRAMEDEIGILPYPKYDSSTPKYYTPLEAGVNLFIVPITSPDTERTSIIVEALSAEGHKTVIPTFYEKALKTKHARDDESSSMLDYIKDGVVYDYGYFNNTLTGDLQCVGVRLVTSKDANFTSFYEKNESKIQKNIEKLR